jgi:hypothetical protein
MSTTVTFDTLKYAEALKTSGVPDAQAKAQAEALADALRQGDLDLATKADIAELRMSTQADIAELRMSTKVEIADLKAELIKWNVGTLIAMTGLFAAIVKLL